MESEELQDLGRRRALALESGDVLGAEILRRRRAAVGRALARDSDGTLGWCSVHEELHSSDQFPKAPKAKTGLASDCYLARSEYRQGARKPRVVLATLAAEPEPPPLSGAVCESCQTPWDRPKKSRARFCPPCRAERTSQPSPGRPRRKGR